MGLGIFNKSIKCTKEELYKTAIHEVGHAIVSVLNKDSVPMDKVSILSKGGALGFTSFYPKRDEFLISKARLLSNIDNSLGGRVAEDIFYGND